MYIVNYRRRTEAACAFFFVFFLLCIARLFYIQLFRSDYLGGIAKKQHNLFVELEPRRGTIYDRNFKPQAVNLAYESVFASPNSMDENQKAAALEKFVSVLKLDRAFVQERLSRNKSFVWISRKIDPGQAASLRQSKIKGIGFLKESKRCYPNGYMLSHIIGFAGMDNNGLEGLELYHDQTLAGEPGWALMQRDARSKRLNLNDRMAPAQDGLDLVLTIDEVVQYIAERELDKAYRQSRAKGASIVVLDPRSGQILAMANRPTYDLNAYKGVSKEQMRNRSITDMYEPGSVFKIVTAAAALQENKVTETSRFFCENGEYRVASHTLHDHTPHGWLTFREVIELSSNIGTSKVAQLLGPDTLYRYIKSFGFGERTGVDLPGEIPGSIKAPRFWSKVSIACVPMGQEVGVTCLQLAVSIAAIANGGTLVRPYILKEICDKSGETVKAFPAQLVRQVISEDTAARLRKILIGVVENGTGKLAKPASFTAGGKTGTAQKLDPNGRYSHDKYMASFVGFAPAQDPLLAIAVTIDEPRGYYYGGVVAAPVFKAVVEDVLKYYKGREFQEQGAAGNDR